MDAQDEVIECPCYRLCAALGLELRRWCRYRKADLPPPGLHRFDPKDEWCPPGVQASVLMLGYMLSGETGDQERLRPALEQVRRWAQRMKREASTWDPAKPGNA
jgi:hypothetical protein